MENTHENNQRATYKPGTVAGLSRKQNDANQNVFFSYVQQKYNVDLAGQGHFLTPFYSKITSGHCPYCWGRYADVA